MQQLPIWNSRGNPLGEEKALWSAGNEPAAFCDLWQDVATALDDLSVWSNTIPLDEQCFHRLWSDRASAAATIGTFERLRCGESAYEIHGIQAGYASKWTG